MDYVLEQLLRQRSLFVSLLGKKPSKNETVEVEYATNKNQKYGGNSTLTTTRTAWTGIGAEEKEVSSQIQSVESLTQTNRMAGEEERGGSSTVHRSELAERGEPNGMTEQWLREVTIDETISAEKLSCQLERDARRYDGDLTLF